MAFNLKAILAFDGSQFDSGMKRAGRLMDQNKRMMDQLSGATSNASRHHRDLGASASKLSSGLGSLKSTILGVAAAYASVEGAKKVFESTVGEAMNREVSAISIGAMFDTKQASDAYQKMMKDMALDSPVLSFKDMAEGSKRVLALTRDSKTLQKTWKNVEKLQAFAPDKSTEEAIRAISELASGDIVSMKEVFNLDKTQLNALKGLSFKEQVDGLDKMLAKMKITDGFINKIGSTTYAKFNQVKESFDNLLVTMGGPSLDVMSNFFDGILKRLSEGDATRFANIGANWIKNILTGLTNSVIGIYDWFAALTSSQQWKDATTLSAKINIVIDDLLKRFNNWYEVSGKKHIETMTQSLTKTLADSLTQNSDDIAAAALTIGGKIAASLQQGIWDGIKDNWLLSTVMTRGVGGVSAAFKAGQELGKNLFNKDNTGTDNFGSKRKSHNGGLSYVPYDGYKANLHRGEQVLTRQEASDYRSGKVGGNISVVITGNTFGGSTQQDAKQLFELFVKEVEASAAGGA